MQSAADLAFRRCRATTGDRGRPWAVACPGARGTWPSRVQDESPGPGEQVGTPRSAGRPRDLGAGVRRQHASSSRASPACDSGSPAGAGAVGSAPPTSIGLRPPAGMHRVRELRQGDVDGGMATESYNARCRSRKNSAPVQNASSRAKVSASATPERISSSIAVLSSASRDRLSPTSFRVTNWTTAGAGD
jgi:hypothetical protein